MLKAQVERLTKENSELTRQLQEKKLTTLDRVIRWRHNASLAKQQGEQRKALGIEKILSMKADFSNQIIQEASEKLDKLQQTLMQQPHDEATRNKVQQQVSILRKAYRSLIDEQLAMPGVIHKCDDVIAESKTFGDVYGAVFVALLVGDEDGFCRYQDVMKAAKAKLGACISADSGLENGCFGEQSCRQRAEANDATVLYCDALAVRERARSALEVVAKSCDAELSEKMPLKRMARAIEKAELTSNSSPERLLDIVRDMLIAQSMSEVGEVVQRLMACDVIELVRLKDRFEFRASGGWRDVLINYRVIGDEKKHICEVQVVHRDMYLARSQLPGHAVYSHVRIAVELLESIGMQHKWNRLHQAKRLADERGWDSHRLLSMGVCQFPDLPVKRLPAELNRRALATTMCTS